MATGLRPDGPALQTAGRLLADYRLLPGVPDELIGRDGALRPGWAPLIAHLAGLRTSDFLHDIVKGEQYLAEAGVFFRSYNDQNPAGRGWPFSPVPVILPEAEWLQITEALAERADLLEAVMADLYGPGRLVAEGLLPARLVAENPAWLRPMVGVRPRSGHFLHFLAFEIGRGPDGRWWLLSNRTDAPSGAGFALENRVAASRVFGRFYADQPVHRLAGFFRDLRDHLASLSPGGGTGRAAILTPGPLTDTYYEQAYIARYLGLHLLEGADLTVQDGRLALRTVRGPSPIDVLWRRMDSEWCDPLELNEASQLGTPGLLGALRSGGLTMLNAPGAGVVEAQALFAFLPGIARALTGRPLRMPNVATWWCGGKAELEHVRIEAARMMIGPALSPQLALEASGPRAVAGTLSGAAPGTRLDDWIAAHGPDLVGQEIVTLSTTPVWDGAGRLLPRPMTIRVFLARGPEGWRAMPGGFARIGGAGGATALSMRAGGSVADVWVVGEGAAREMSMLPASGEPFRRADPGALPARAADNLFWLGRYVERTEGLLRLSRAWHARMAEPGGRLADILLRVLLRYGVDPRGTAVPDGIRTTFSAAVRAASQMRDRFSTDGWAALQDIDKSMGRLARGAGPGQDAALVMGIFLRKLSGFSGLVHDNMLRGEGWDFLTIGRALERAAMLADWLADLARPEAPLGALDLAIELGDSVIIHRQRYAVLTRRESVMDLLVHDGRNPRALAFQLRVLAERVGDLIRGGARAPGPAADLSRAISDLSGRLALQGPERLTPEDLRALQSGLLALTAALNAAFLD